jgi:predicted dehydrogenase
VGLIGVGGRGDWFVGAIPRIGQNLAALCDVDDSKNPSAYQRFPKVKRFHDYRRMLDDTALGLDAVVVAAPDHIHAPASIRAMRMGKHVYCEKPLTNTVNESRRMREVARQSGVATQMGNQGTASNGYRQAVEIIQAGVIGQVRHVHAWNNQGGPGRRPQPSGAQQVPDFLRWNLWLGPRQERPYHRTWLNWHGWREFGTGNLGNWAPHMLNLPFRALRLDSFWSTDSTPATGQDGNGVVRIQADVSAIDTASLPKWEVVQFDFPARYTQPQPRLFWYNGGAGGFRPRLEDLLGRKLDWGDAGERKWSDWAGVLIVGTKGMLYTNAHNTEFTLLPKRVFADLTLPLPKLPRSPGHENEWVNACTGGEAAVSNFDYASALTELCLLGNVATQFPETLVFDPRTCRITNHAEAHLALRREHRLGWEV